MRDPFEDDHDNEMDVDQEDGMNPPWASPQVQRGFEGSPAVQQSAWGHRGLDHGHASTSYAAGPFATPIAPRGRSHPLNLALQLQGPGATPAPLHGLQGQPPPGQLFAQTPAMARPSPIHPGMQAAVHMSSPLTPSSPMDPCPVCFTSLGVGPTCALPCSHVFHRHCIRRCAEHAAQGQERCPMCRGPLLLTASPFAGLEREPQLPLLINAAHAPFAANVVSRAQRIREVMAARLQGYAAGMAMPGIQLQR